MENTSFTTQQVSTVRSLQKPCTTFGIFLFFSSDLSWMLRLLLLLWFHPWLEKGLKDSPVFVFFPVLQGKVASARAGTLNMGLAEEKVNECFAGVQHSCTLRSSQGMETDEKRERCDKKGVVRIEVLHFRGWAAGTDLQHPALSSLHLTQAKVPMQSAWKMWQFNALLTRS